MIIPVKNFRLGRNSEATSVGREEIRQKGSLTELGEVGTVSAAGCAGGELGSESGPGVGA
jgi:hypothetical protein